MYISKEEALGACSIYNEKAYIHIKAQLGIVRQHTC